MHARVCNLRIIRSKVRRRLINMSGFGGLLTRPVPNTEPVTDDGWMMAKSSGNPCIWSVRDIPTDIIAQTRPAVSSPMRIYSVSLTFVWLQYSTRLSKERVPPHAL